jgi:predicted Fe-Mo cluster-binding NifX family protein
VGSRAIFLEDATMSDRIAFTTSGDDLGAPLDSRFGRAPKFLVQELDGSTFEVVDNQQNLNAAQGAGIQSAEMVVRLGVKVLVTGHCGPKAFRVLQRAGVKIFCSDAATVAEALQRYRAGVLTELQMADVDGHWA